MIVYAEKSQGIYKKVLRTNDLLFTFYKINIKYQLYFYILAINNSRSKF